MDTRNLTEKANPLYCFKNNQTKLSLNLFFQRKENQPSCDGTYKGGKNKFGGPVKKGIHYRMKRVTRKVQKALKKIRRRKID